LGGGLTAGGAATQRLLAAAEILESDLWQQDNELALGNEAFQQVLQVPDGDMPTYVNQNTRDEFSHAAFINAYLISKGHSPVSPGTLSHLAQQPGDRREQNLQAIDQLAESDGRYKLVRSLPEHGQSRFWSYLRANRQPSKSTGNSEYGLE